MKLYRRFEECLNHLFHSCIPNSSVYIYSFAHNEDEDCKELKYDVHANDLEAAKSFLLNVATAFEKIANIANGTYDCNCEAVKQQLPSMSSLFEYPSPDVLPFICTDGFCLAFDFYPWYEGADPNSHLSKETGYTLFYNGLNYEMESQFVDFCCKAFGWTPAVSAEADAEVYKDADWCWGERFVITHDGVKYVGEDD